MKGKNKTQKGITLIALIITIVVLLILAAVAISSITNDGILNYAQNATTDYNQAVKNEQSMLQEYEDYLTGINGGFDEYKIGDEVTIGTEHFYVIKDSAKTESKVLLLAKQNIDTTNLVQSLTADPIAFSEEAYWLDEEGNVFDEYEEIYLAIEENDYTYYYDLTEKEIPDSTHYAAYAAYQYGTKLGGMGRLLTYKEIEALDDDRIVPLVIIGQKCHNFWLATAKKGLAEFGEEKHVLYYFGITEELGYSESFDYLPSEEDLVEGYGNAVRPVIEISKSKVTPVTE